MSDNQVLQARLEALEIKASYCDDLLESLNLTIYQQQQQIDRLGQMLQALRQQLPEPGAGTAPDSLHNEAPPHY